jgi:hypothetical protein
MQKKLKTNLDKLELNADATESSEREFESSDFTENVD